MQLKGFGPRTLDSLKKHNINSLKEFLLDFPTSYELVTISDTYSEDSYIRARFLKKPYFKKVDNKTFTFFTLNIGGVSFNCSYFGLKIYYANVNLKLNYLFKVKRKDNTRSLLVLDFLPDSRSDFVLMKYRFNLFNRANLLRTLIQNLKPPVDLVPARYTNKYNLLPFPEYIIKSHFPTSKEDLEAIYKRREYTDAFLYFARLNKLILATETKRLVKPYDSELVSEFIQNLPFSLTKSQINVLEAITLAFYSDTTFQKLVEGDVGTGKTIVAFILAYISYLQGYSSFLIAPTEILASQHFNNAKSIFSDVPVFLITGSTSTKEKNLYYNLMKEKPVFIIATHALFYKKFDESYKVGLIQIDEQHRFGVKQRSYLKEQFPFADVVFYSATPIPRSLSIFMFQEDNILTLTDYPFSKREIKTSIYNFSYFFFLRDFFFEKIAKKEQVIIVCSRVKEEDSDLNLYNVSDIYKHLTSFIDPKYVAILHGRMSNAEKEKVYSELVNLEKFILIATTVVEVGVDLKRATSIFILNAERFGLAQLHQLRGRVGRSGLRSDCFLVSDYNLDRLNYLTKTDDGFLIAEYDLKLRGAGDLFGLEQSGHAFNYESTSSAEIRNLANSDAKNFLLEASSDELNAVFADIENTHFN